MVNICSEINRQCGETCVFAATSIHISLHTFLVHTYRSPVKQRCADSHVWKIEFQSKSTIPLKFTTLSFNSICFCRRYSEWKIVSSMGSAVCRPLHYICVRLCSESGTPFIGLWKMHSKHDDWLMNRIKWNRYWSDAMAKGCGARDWNHRTIGFLETMVFHFVEKQIIEFDEIQFIASNESYQFTWNKRY